MSRVQRRAAVDPRVQVALAGAQRDVEVGEPARGEIERRHVAPDHAAVEDDRRVGAALVRLEEVDDRVTAGLLLAVAAEANVHRQLPGLRQLARGGEQHVELPLVVDGAAAVEVAVAHLRLERIATPRARADPAAARRSGRNRAPSAPSPPPEARSSPIDERLPVPVDRARPRRPPARMSSQTHSPAAHHVAACAGSALTEGMRRNSASSSNQSRSSGESSRARRVALTRRRGASGLRRAARASSATGSRSGGPARA